MKGWQIILTLLVIGFAAWRIYSQTDATGVNPRSSENTDFSKVTNPFGGQ